MKSRNKTTHVLLAALVLGLTVSPFAVAKVGDALRAGRENSYDGQTVFVAKNSGTGYRDYGTRFTNTGDGGGAILATHGSGPAMRATSKISSQPGLGLSVAAEKGPAAEFETSDSSAAPFKVGNSNKIDKLHAENSDQLNGQSADRYAAAGAKINGDGAVMSPPTSYGIGSVTRTGAGAYNIVLNDTANKYLIQLTPTTAGTFCRVDSVSTSSGTATVECRAVATNTATDSGFYLLATKP